MNQLDTRLEFLRRQISVFTGTPESASAPEVKPEPEKRAPECEPFLPLAPDSLAASRLSQSQIEALVLKFLLNQISATGREIADQISLPFGWIDHLLAQMKADQLLVHKGGAPLGDYLYQLTGAGVDTARRHYKHCSYFGAAPVHLDDYIASVHAQSVRAQMPTIDDLDGVFADLLLSSDLFNQVGQAIHAGHAFFLYGAPGNGKTSIAERVTRAFGQHIWLPRAIEVDGEIIRIYDPCKHVEVELSQPQINEPRIDRRWVRVRRPTLVVGGELTMEQLEITRSAVTGVSEAPLQLKSNCGTLVIDDFGRQRIGIAELLNRWIVPLDRHYDFLNLPSGKTIQVPFDQLLIFSTNLEPRELVDEAFLRRIPYKIEVFDPSENDFRELFRLYAPRFELECSEAAVEYLIEKHYRACNRRFRFCHPRDLLLQIRNYCRFNRRPFEVAPEHFDIAVRNYFAVMS